MTKVAFFTDENNRVVLKHSKINQLSDSRLEQSALVVDQQDIPSPPTLNENENYNTFIRNGNIEYEVFEQVNEDPLV